MEIKIPKTPEATTLIKALREIYPLIEEENFWKITVEKDIIIPRAWSNLSIFQFRKFTRTIQVKGGRKFFRGDELAIRLSRKKIFKIRLSEKEEQFIVEAAECLGQSAAEFIRETAISRAEKILGRKLNETS